MLTGSVLPSPNRLTALATQSPQAARMDSCSSAVCRQPARLAAAMSNAIDLRFLPQANHCITAWRTTEANRRFALTRRSASLAPSRSGWEVAECRDRSRLMQAAANRIMHALSLAQKATLMPT